VDASDRLEQMVGDLVQIVETAKSVPMSASCVINRAEVLEILAQLRVDLGEELEESRRLTAERDEVIAQARRDAQEHIEQARRERGSMLSGTEMGREAERIRNEALREAGRIREDADAYVDDKLANFEVVLTKTLQAVGRGRAKMGGRDAMDDLGQHVAEQDAVTAASRADYEFDERDHELPPARGEAAEPFAGAGGGRYQREAASRIEYHTGEYPVYTEEGYAAVEPAGYQQPDSYQEQPAYEPQQPAYEPQPSYEQQPAYEAQPAYEPQPAYASHQSQSDYGLPEPDLSREFSQADMSGIFQRPDYSQVAPQPVHAAYGYETEPGQYNPAPAGYEYDPQQAQAYPVQPYGSQYAAQPEYHTGEYPVYDENGYPVQQAQQPQAQQDPQQGQDATGFFDTGMIDVRQFRDDPYQR
jgi:hypothetical protein